MQSEYWLSQGNIIFHVIKSEKNYPNVFEGFPCAPVEWAHARAWWLCRSDAWVSVKSVGKKLMATHFFRQFKSQMVVICYHNWFLNYTYITNSTSAACCPLMKLGVYFNTILSSIFELANNQIATCNLFQHKLFHCFSLTARIWFPAKGVVIFIGNNVSLKPVGR